MATIKPSWTENQSITLSDTSPADNVQATGTIDAREHEATRIQISVQFPASVSDFVRVNIYGSSDGGSTWDTIEGYNQQIDAVSSTTIVLSMTIENEPRIRLEIDNQCNQEITSLSATYAYKQYTSA